jgi:magnesium chelatase subunit I
MRWRTKTVYPFSAIVGQEKMKLSLILNVINPKIGGVLLRGEKGTGKSLVVRALAHLLPEVNVVADCPFHCDPASPKEMCDACSTKVANGEKLPAAKRPVSVVELPIGATEDRLVGTLDIEQAIKTGKKHFEPGILAEANRNILYIDEVNLLDDHLVDVLLDAAAMGVNYVERE